MKTKNTTTFNADLNMLSLHSQQLIFVASIFIQYIYMFQVCSIMAINSKFITKNFRLIMLNRNIFQFHMIPHHKINCSKQTTLVVLHSCFIIILCLPRSITFLLSATSHIFLHLVNHVLIPWTKSEYSKERMMWLLVWPNARSLLSSINNCHEYWKYFPIRD